MSEAAQNYVRIPLTQGKFAIIDAEDYEKVGSFKWCYDSGYCQRASNKLESPNKKIKIRMHRFILDAPKGFDVDHIDGNGLNNSRSNLRLATRSQNCCNKNANSNSSTGVRGVSLVNGKYVARIKISGGEKRLGSFNSIEEAKLAYEKEALIVQGEFYRPHGTSHQTIDAIDVPRARKCQAPQSGFRYVYWKHGAWNGCISHKRTTVNIGSFPTPQLASAAVEAKIKELRS